LNTKLLVSLTAIVKKKFLSLSKLQVHIFTILDIHSISHVLSYFINSSKKTSNRGRYLKFIPLSIFIFFSINVLVDHLIVIVYLCTWFYFLVFYIYFSLSRICVCVCSVYLLCILNDVSYDNIEGSNVYDKVILEPRTKSISQLSSNR